MSDNLKELDFDIFKPVILLDVSDHLLHQANKDPIFKYYNQFKLINYSQKYPKRTVIGNGRSGGNKPILKIGME